MAKKDEVVQEVEQLEQVEQQVPVEAVAEEAPAAKAPAKVTKLADGTIRTDH